MIITKNTVVTMDYILRDKAGDVIDTSQGRGPLSYIQGMGNIIIGLEKQLEGRKAGDNVIVSIPPAEAYGEFQETLVLNVPRAHFPPNEALEPGFQFRAETNNGFHVFTIMEVNDDTVMVNGNHPLAGQTLNFDVIVREVREATPEELAHGHVHAAGGCCGGHGECGCGEGGCDCDEEGEGGCGCEEGKGGCGCH